MFRKIPFGRIACIIGCAFSFLIAANAEGLDGIRFAIIFLGFILVTVGAHAIAVFRPKK